MSTHTATADRDSDREAQTLHGALERSVAGAPDDPFLLSGDRSVSYRDLAREVEETARRLHALGFRAGERVVLWLPNGLDWVRLFFACARLGIQAVLASTRLRTLDLRHILDDSGARGLFFAPSFCEVDFDAMVRDLMRMRSAGAFPQLSELVSTGPASGSGTIELDAVAPAARAPTGDDPGSAALVCYTSGTSGRPKGCVHDHRTLVRNGWHAARLTGLRPGSRLVSAAPFAHVFGFHMSVLQPVMTGATVINAEPFDPSRMLDLLERHRGTILYAVPTMATEVVAEQARQPRDLSSLEVTVLGGAPVSRELRRRITSTQPGLGSGLSVVYGCTEAPTLAQLRPADPDVQLLRSVGRPTPGVEVRVCEPGTFDRMVPVGSLGEIVVRGYNQMLGYLGETEATSARRRDGWLRTGDLGRLDAQGYLYVTGRADEVFGVGGFNVYPREVEAQLESLPGIREAVVVPVPDRRLGAVPMAWLTVDDDELGDEEILERARETLASYKRPRYVKVVSELPRTSSTKTARMTLTQRTRQILPNLPWERARSGRMSEEDLTGRGG